MNLERSPSARVVASWLYPTVSAGAEIGANFESPIDTRDLLEVFETYNKRKYYAGGGGGGYAGVSTKCCATGTCSS